MKSNMSQSDKRLLLVLFLFVIVVGIGYWGVYPQIRAFVKLEGEIDKQEVIKSVNDQKINNLVFVESQCEEYQNSILKNKDRFFELMNEADIDLMLTGKAISHNLESFNLNIDIPSSPSQRKAYRYSELLLKQQEYEKQRLSNEDEAKKSPEDEIEELTSSDQKKKKNETEDSVTQQAIDDKVDVFGDTELVGVNEDIYAARVNMTLGGNRDDLESFLEELMESEKQILITSFSWGEYRAQIPASVGDETDTESNNNEFEVVEMDSLTIAMEIFMCANDEETEVE